MSEVWKFGLVGVGGKARSLDYTHDPRVQVAAMCDVDETALEAAGRRFDLPTASLFTSYDELLESEVDAVLIATPMPFHAEQAVAALEAGKHVLSEVTAANTVEGCEHIVDAAEKSGKVYMLAENNIYLHYIREWKHLIGADGLGQIVHAEAEHLHDIRHQMAANLGKRVEWRYDRAPLHYCSHSLGPLLYLMGDRVKRAMGIGTSQRTSPGEPRPGLIDMQVALFETEQGASIKILRSQVAPRRPTLMYYFCLYGTKGFVENGRFGVGTTTGYLYREGEPGYEDGAQVVEWDPSDPAAPPRARESLHGTSEYFVLQDFLDAMEGGGQQAIDPWFAMDITVPGIVAHESATRGGVWLDVPRFG